MVTQNFFFVPRSWQDEKTSFLILYRAKILFEGMISSNFSGPVLDLP